MEDIPADLQTSDFAVLLLEEKDYGVPAFSFLPLEERPPTQVELLQLTSVYQKAEPEVILRFGADDRNLTEWSRYPADFYSVRGFSTEALAEEAKAAAATEGQLSEAEGTVTVKLARETLQIKVDKSDLSVRGVRVSRQSGTLSFELSSGKMRTGAKELPEGKQRMQIHLPEKVNLIIEKLQTAGYEAYAVGGCVRDSLLGRTPDDWDITTSAKPEQVKALFRRTVDTGIEHGTVTVLLGREGFEVTTYRIDGEYADARHPKEVTFTPDLREDLKRRDFTINAMAYNVSEGLVDAFGGLKDLDKRMIRCVGKAEERFLEDALRMLRAVRFSAQLGYEIEEETEAAIRRLAPNLDRISAERVRVELTKLVTSPHPEYLRKAYETGVTAVVLPEFDRAMETAQNHPHHIYNVGEHILHAMQAVPPDPVLRLTMLLHDIAKPLCLTVDENGISHFKGHALASEKMAEQILHRLKFDNDTIRRVTKLVRYHDLKPLPEAKAVRRTVHTVGEDLFPLFLEVKRADMLAQSPFEREEKERRLEAIVRQYEKILAEKNCLSLKDLAVDGRDLLAAGIQPGRQIGLTLNALLDLVLEEPSRNTGEYLLKQLPVLLSGQERN